ncbi:hypothetical protein [Acetonema longum]|uniref:Uncharacterized protein n=1 Tax=Acetonema longum DSM 6540 TaxID=1009370 RepID=F7NL79_9FIRM|nr:hypothetical protein [Acetonema longum]EGO63184.1 hypothetical protein ALO_14257 [Acetonema longum DSM 6540]
MDFVGYPWKEAEVQLQQNRIEYRCVAAHPSVSPHKGFHLNENCWFVVRQRQEDGVYHLVVAAKMGKEVFLDGLQN